MAAQDSVVPITQWQPPPHGFYKCNLDASFWKARNKKGIGMCLRDEDGRFISARTEVVTPFLRVHEGEALCLRHALCWIASMGITKVFFDIDNKLVVDSIHQQ